MADRFGVYPVIESTKGLFREDILSAIYSDLECEGLLDVVFHEKHYSLDEFVDFAQSPSTLFCVFIDHEMDVSAGVCWVADLCRMRSHTKAAGGFAFYRRWWRPDWTMQMGIAALRLWFDGIPLDLLYGITPRENRLSRLYCTRLGFRYHAVIPGFTSFGGHLSDAMVCTMTRNEFHARHGGG